MTFIIVDISFGEKKNKVLEGNRCFIIREVLTIVSRNDDIISRINKVILNISWVFL